MAREKAKAREPAMKKKDRVSPSAAARPAAREVSMAAGAACGQDAGDDGAGACTKPELLPPPAVGSNGAQQRPESESAASDDCSRQQDDTSCVDASTAVSPAAPAEKGQGAAASGEGFFPRPPLGSNREDATARLSTRGMLQVTQNTRGMLQVTQKRRRLSARTDQAWRCSVLALPQAAQQAMMSPHPS